MIPPIQAIRRVLWGNVYCEGKKVPVIKRNYPYDKTPCVTIDDSASSGFVHREITTEKYPVKEGHPLYDPFHPFKEFPQQVLREVWQVSINISSWSDSLNQQEELNNNIMDLFHKAQSDYYLFCDQYHEGDCSFMDSTCYAKHFYDSNSLSIRGVKGQCPNPELYGYKNIFTTYNLYRDSFMVEQPFNLEDDSMKDTVYHSVFKLHTGYFTDHIIGGLNFKNVIFDKECL